MTASVTVIEIGKLAKPSATKTAVLHTFQDGFEAW